MQNIPHPLAGQGHAGTPPSLMAMAPVSTTSSAADIVPPPLPEKEPTPPDPSPVCGPTAGPGKEEKAAKGDATSHPESTPFPLSPLLEASRVEAIAPVAPFPESDDVFTAPVRGNPVIRALRDEELYLRQSALGQHAVTCPFAGEHPDGATGHATYHEPSRQRPLGAFVCPHGHAEALHIDRLLDRLSIGERAARCKPCIRIVPGEMMRVIDYTERCLNAVGGYYQSGGAIVTIKKAAFGDAVSAPVSEHALIKAMAVATDWERFDGASKSWKRCDPTTQVAKQLLHVDHYEHLPTLDHIARQPYFREADGVLVTAPGYDAVSQTYASFPRAFPAVLGGEAAARAALIELRDLLTEFQFTAEVDRSAALCAILTAAARSSLPLAPAFNITASTPGSGKSYLATLLATFAGPGEPLNLSYPTTSDEATKAMLAALIGKPAVISFDDMQTDWLPHGMINRMLTSETVADRLLGSNNTKQVSTKTFVMGTGNNVSPVRDMCRRVVTIALRPQTASPATLRYEDKPVEKVKAARERFVALALTVIRAWREASLPKADVPPIATFGQWSDMCRQPLIWLGEPDPATSLIEQVRSDPDAEAFERLMVAWYNLFGSRATTLRKIIDRSLGESNLQDAIMDLPVIESGRINNHKLGWFLKKNANRIVNGMFVQKEPSSERNAWSVQYADPGAAPAQGAVTNKPKPDKEAIKLPDDTIMIDGEIF